MVRGYALAVLTLSCAAGSGGAWVAPPAVSAGRVDFLGDPLPEGAIARLGTSRLRFPNGVGEVFFSHDGKELISGVMRRRGTTFWDSRTGKELRRIPLPLGSRRSLSADDWRVATVGRRQGEVYDVRTGTRIRAFRMPEDRTSGLNLSPDGKFVAVGGHSGTIYVYEVDVDKLPHRLRGHEYAIRRLVFSSDSRYLASSDSAYDSDKRNHEEIAHIARIWDTRTGKQVQAIPGHIGGVWPMAFTPDSKGLAICGLPVRVYNIASGKEVERLGKQHISDVAFSPDSQLAALATHDGIQLWDRRKGAVLHTLHGNRSYSAGRFSPDSTMLVTASADNKSVRLWNTRSGELLPIPPGPREPALTMALSPNDRTLATGQKDGSIRLWDLNTGRMLQELTGHTGQIVTLLFCPDGRRLVSRAAGVNLTRRSIDYSIRVWDLKAGKQQHTFPKQVCTFPALDLAPDGKTLAVGGQAGLHFLNLDKGGERPSWTKAPDLPACKTLAYSADGKLLAVVVAQKVGSPGQGPLRLIDPHTGEEQATLPVSALSEVSYSPNGRLLAITLGKGEVQLWDVVRRRECASLWIAARTAGRVVFSPDGQLFTASTGARTLRVGETEETTIRVWEVATGQEVMRFPGYGAAPSQLLFNHDGKRLLSRVDDDAILVWDLQRPPGLPQVSGERPGAVQLARYWKQLAEPTEDGFRAGLQLLRWPAETVKLLDGQLRAEPKRDVKQIKALLQQLDSDRSQERDQAARELGELAELAEPELRAALTGSSAEKTRQVRRLLGALGKETLPGRWLPAVRAVRLLEQIGSPAARSVLRRLVGGEPLAEPTRAGQAALKRLERRSSHP